MIKRHILGNKIGGELSRKLIDDVFQKHLSNKILDVMDDAAHIESKDFFKELLDEKSFSDFSLAITTDSYVVKPLFWNGGDIGKLAICGTVNDLCMIGAIPKHITLSCIIEEGLEIEFLEKIVKSISETAAEAKVQIVAGDTKVVEKMSADQLFLNTTGLGYIPKNRKVSGHNAKEGDVVIISGNIGEHGLAVLSKREGLRFDSDVISDVAPLNSLVEKMFEVTDKINVLRDPTRGGLATTLNEIARQSQKGILIYEEKIPISSSVQNACELLGYDPIYIANEGKLVAIVDASEADCIIKTMRNHKYGKNSTVIGRVINENKGSVLMKTKFGPTRFIDPFSGELLPRIC